MISKAAKGSSNNKILGLLNKAKHITNRFFCPPDKNSALTDARGYHKALYTAMNADAVAKHFYEQGKADAVRDIAAKSKNITQEARPQQGGEVYINGLRVKAISGVDSSKLKFKKITTKT